MLRVFTQYRPFAARTGLLLVLSLALIEVRADALPASVDKPAHNLPPIEVARESGNDPDLDPAKIEEAGAVIGEVTIKNRNIFDLNDPLDNNHTRRPGILISVCQLRAD